MTRTRSRIVLVGGMGAGKTCVGRALASRWGWEFLDSDAEVERRTGRTVRELFAGDGEATFRAHEEGVLRDWARGDASRCVMALGGGGPAHGAAYDALASTAAVVWLRVSAEGALARLAPAAVTERPLLAGGDPHAALDALLRSRAAAYARHAALIVETDGRSVDDAVAAIVRWWDGDAA